MGFLKKLWKDRLSAFPRQYKMTEVSSTETSKVVELELQDGTVLTQGDRFNAATMNDLEDRIENAFNSISAGVTSFNDREGDVEPSNADYSSDMIKHINTDASESTVQDEINEIKTEIVAAASDMTGATSSSGGEHGIVPAPLIADRAKFLRGDGTWQTISLERSYVGMIIHSTTLDTMAKVVAFYGGTTWIQHSGYVLRGATSGVTANSATKTGGADSVTLATTQIPSHRHAMAYDNSGAHYLPRSLAPVAVQNGWADANSLKGNGAFSDTASGSSGGTVIQPTGGGQAHSTLPNYKSVYIWERTV